jgi:hypothetical protein
MSNPTPRVVGTIMLLLTRCLRAPANGPLQLTCGNIRYRWWGCACRGKSRVFGTPNCLRRERLSIIKIIQTIEPARTAPKRDDASQLPDLEQFRYSLGRQTLRARPCPGVYLRLNQEADLH